MQHRLDRLVELAAEHEPCSVRHLFYRSVVDEMPYITKDDRGYDKIQYAVLKLRREGRMPYSWIVDNSRTVFTVNRWNGTDGFLNEVAALYRRDLWGRSPWRVELWCESDSIASTVRDLGQRWCVDVFPMRGQSSETFAYNAVQEWLDEPLQRRAVLYLGDHDPAGLEIEASLRDKLNTFAAAGGLTYEPWFQRLAATWEQVEELDLPGTPPKKSYGFPLAVEAEALPPRMLREIVDQEIASYVDHQELETLLAVEREERRGLLALAHGGAA